MEKLLLSFSVAVLAVLILKSNGRALPNISKNKEEMREDQWCSAGQYLQIKNSRRFCQTCPEKQYMDKAGNWHFCYDCTLCDESQHLEKHCTNTNDTLCVCPYGKYWKVYRGNTGICLTHTVCHGETLKQGNATNDAVCGASTTTLKPNLTSSIKPSTKTTLYSTNRTTPPSMNTVPCDSFEQNVVSDNKWFVTAVVESVFIVIAVLVLVVVYCRKKCLNRQPDSPNSQVSYDRNENGDGSIELSESY